MHHTQGFARRWQAVGYLAGLLVSTACGSQEQTGFGAMTVVGQGIVNDPANKTLRFDLLRYGLAKFCHEMQQRGVALKLRDGQPIAGRFFASSCQSELLENGERQTLALRYAGRGYTWTNVTGRVGFEVQGFIEYAPDFKLHDDTLYIYFRPQNVDASRFHTTLVEAQAPQAGLAVLGVSADQLGHDTLIGQLRRGFTVVRARDGATDFAPGLLPAGEHPFHPFEIRASDKVTLDNNRTELHAGQQDYIGGFAVEEGQALFLTLTLDGASAVDVLVLPEAQGRQMITQYTTVAGPAVPPTAPYGVVLPAATGLRQGLPLPAGRYLLLLDHSNAVGQVAPPPGFAPSAARVDYLVQAGARP